MGVPGLEGKRDELMSEIQLLLLGPQVLAPAATGSSSATVTLSNLAQPAAAPPLPPGMAHAMSMPLRIMSPRGLAASQAPQSEAPQAPQTGVVLYVRKTEESAKTTTPAGRLMKG